MHSAYLHKIKAEIVQNNLLEYKTNRKEVHGSKVEYVIDHETYSLGVCCQMFSIRIFIPCLALDSQLQ
jgi:hypothetical protein